MIVIKSLANAICRTAIVIVLASCLLLSDVFAQPTPVRWSIRSVPATGSVKLGRKISIEVVAKIADGWHFFSITQPKGGPSRTVFLLPEAQPFKLEGAIKGPKPTVKFDQTFRINTESYEDEAIFTLPIKVTDDASLGSQELSVTVRFQSCNGEVCLQPRTERLELQLMIE